MIWANREVCHQSISHIPSAGWLTACQQHITQHSIVTKANKSWGTKLKIRCTYNGLREAICSDKNLLKHWAGMSSLILVQKLIYTAIHLSVLRDGGDYIKVVETFVWCSFIYTLEPNYRHFIFTFFILDTWFWHWDKLENKFIESILT